MDLHVLSNEINEFSGSETRDISRTAALNILEGVVHDLKCTNSINKFDYESHSSCNQISNDILIDIVRNKHENVVTEKTFRTIDKKIATHAYEAMAR